MVSQQKEISIVMVGIFLIFLFLALFGFSQETTSWKDISFTAHERAIKLFDRRTGRVYTYSSISGELLSVWQVDALGRPLRRIR